MSSADRANREVSLRGITWDHSRGFTPMVATAQRFHELHPNVDIAWTRRSLQEFADKPISMLAEQFDLLVIDHPWAGFASRSRTLANLAALFSPGILDDLAANSVGKSHASYQFDGGQWALAIDAAAPVSAWRPDLMNSAGVEAPRTWEELIALGRKGLVCCPSIPLDVYGNFLNLCVSDGAGIFTSDEEVTQKHNALTALERLKELTSLIPPQCLALNPIRTLEAMTQTDDFAYCPFTYGYSNYARHGYGRNTLAFGAVVSVASGKTPSTMLGGTGLAISAKCENLDVAVEYVKFVASAETQRGIFFAAGGQPALRSAWLDEKVNAASSNFFLDTLSTLDAAFVRPSYPGYLEFQDQAGECIHRFLRGDGTANEVVETLNQLFRESKASL